VIFKILTLQSHVKEFITLKDMRRIIDATPEYYLAVYTVYVLCPN
jgi:hypothetical protein